MKNGAPAPRNTLRIRQMNDEFRKTFRGGRVVMTSGLAALRPEVQVQIFQAIRDFDEFHPEEGDPWGERDFGSIKSIAGLHIFWKIDLYDKSMEFGSPDGADPTKTTRVLTIMLASEY